MKLKDFEEAKDLANFRATLEKRRKEAVTAESERFYISVTYESSIGEQLCKMTFSNADAVKFHQLVIECLQNRTQEYEARLKELGVDIEESTE